MVILPGYQGMGDGIALENGQPRELKLIIYEGVDPDQDGNDGKMRLAKNTWNRFNAI